MPIEIEFTEDGLGVVLVHEGVVTCEVLKAALSRVYQDERFPRLKYWIGDRTCCTEFLPDTECFKEIAGINKIESRRNPGMLLALVAPTDLEFGMSRMLEAFFENVPFRMQVFRDRQSAEEWIREQLRILAESETK